MAKPVPPPVPGDVDLGDALGLPNLTMNQPGTTVPGTGEPMAYARLRRRGRS